jgi:hypothetical protein
MEKFIIEYIDANQVEHRVEVESVSLIVEEGNDNYILQATEDGLLSIEVDGTLVIFTESSHAVDLDVI